MKSNRIKQSKIRRHFLKSTLFGGVFFLSTMFTSFSSRAVIPTSLEDLIEEYSDELIDLVFASYPGAGDIVEKVKAALQSIQQSFENLFGTDKEHTVKESTGMATVGDAVNEVSRSVFNTDVANRARSTRAGCASQEVSRGFEEISHNAKRLQGNAGQAVTRDAMQLTQSEKVKATAHQIRNTITQSSNTMVDAQYQASVFLSRLGYRDQAHRNYAAQYINNVLSPLTTALDGNGLDISDTANATQQSVFTNSVSSATYLSVLSDALNSLYAARVRSKNTEEAARDGLSDDELPILRAFANNEGLSKIDMMEVTLQRILSNEQAYLDMSQINEHIHPNVTTSMKYILPALAAKNHLQSEVVSQMNIINRLRALELL